MHQDAPTIPAATTDGAPLPASGPGRSAGPDRRSLMKLGAAAGLGVAGAAALTACGSGSDASEGSTGAAGSAASSPAAAASSPAAASGGGALAKLSDVPVGGAYAAAGADGAPIVIAQPEAGTVVAFSAACTHAGCKVVPAGKILNCPCHASTFDAFTGKNLSGPAPTPLAAVSVKVSGTDVVAG